MPRIYTAFSAEFFVAAELARRAYDVAITFGNTKSIDILAQKDGTSFIIQVKGIKGRRNNNFRIKVDKIVDNFWYVLVNTNRFTLGNPEFAILTGIEIRNNLRRDIAENDNAVLPRILDNVEFRNRWDRLV